MPRTALHQPVSLLSLRKRGGNHGNGDHDEVLALGRAGLVLFIEAALFLIVLMLCAEIAPGYGIRGDSLSQLGIDPATAPLFNVSLMAVGLLNLLAAYFFRRSNAGQFTTLIFVLAGVGAAGAGVFNVGIEKHVHAVFASVGFIGHLLMPFALARSASGAMRFVSYLAGLSSVAFLLVWIVGLSGQANASVVIGLGGTQRIIVYPLALWMMFFGGYLMASRKPTNPS